MVRIHTAARLIIWVMALCVLGLAGCDCEQKAKQFIQATPDERKGLNRKPNDMPSHRLEEVEPNNIREQASTIELSRDLKPVYAAIDSAMDVDWFVLINPSSSPALLELNVEPQSPHLDIELQLRVSNQSASPLVYNNNSAGEAELITLLNIEEDPLWLVVQGLNGSIGDYKISIKRRMSAGVIAAEPNDLTDYAIPLQVPGEIQGFYERDDDIDVFRVDTSELTADAYGIEVSPIDNITQILAVYSEQSLKQPMLQSAISPHQSTIIPNIDFRNMGDVVWITLSTGHNNNKPYRLRILEYPAKQRLALEKEPNNTMEWAQTIVIDQPMRGHLHAEDDVDIFHLAGHREVAGAENNIAVRTIDRDDDTDKYDRANAIEDAGHLTANDDVAAHWYARFPEKNPAPRQLHAQLTPLGQGHRLSWRWHSTQGEEVVAMEQSALEQSLFVCDLPDHLGEYNIEIQTTEVIDSLALGKQADYEIAVRDLAGVDGFEIEPNDVSDKADYLQFDTTRIGLISHRDDVDAYGFIINPGQTHPASDNAESTTVNLTIDAHPLNMKFSLTDDEGGIIADVNREGAGGTESLTIDLPAGLYFIHISAIGGFNCDPYRITIRKAH